MSHPVPLGQHCLERGGVNMSHESNGAHSPGSFSTSSGCYRLWQAVHKPLSCPSPTTIQGWPTSKQEINQTQENKCQKIAKMNWKQEALLIPERDTWNISILINCFPFCLFCQVIKDKNFEGIREPCHWKRSLVQSESNKFQISMSVRCVYYPKAMFQRPVAVFIRNQIFLLWVSGIIHYLLI
jgi:hypothetical protein